MTRPPAARQLVLDLAREPCFEAEDFLVSAANADAAAMVRAWPHWPGPALLLVGPPGSGKSHLAAIWAAETAAVRATLTSEDWTRDGRCVVMEDCDRRSVDEPDFFHALNLARETRGWLLMTARTMPGHWNLRVPDLLSRLRLAPVATILQPDAELVRAVLLKLFADRQILIDADVVAYAARHCEQSLGAVNRFVSAVDEAALAEGRRITRPLAAATLASLRREELD